MTKLSPNWPIDTLIMNAGATDLRRKLRQFSDGCYQRATEATDADAMWLFTKAAQEARQRASNRHLSPEALIDALRALELQRNLAAWYNGEGLAYSNDNGPRGIRTATSSHRPPVAREPVEPLNARQLAGIYGMSENGARQVIKRGFGRGLAGFGKHGALWFADVDAFARLHQKCGIG